MIQSKLYYDIYKSPFCDIILVGNKEGLQHLHLNTGKGNRIFELSSSWIKNPYFFKDTISQLDLYFKGKLKSFDIKLNLQGTDFQKKVWNQLIQIPFGNICTYKDIAKSLGDINLSRAVGMANSKNPIPIIIPCHRVMGQNGNLTGFAHGIDIKEKLILLEKNK